MAERPDVMALYPSWWGDLPTYFGEFIAAVPVRGNVICGGAEKVLYRANWRAMDRRGSPRSMHSDERIIDQLDVGDLLSERMHDYDFPRPGMGFVRYRVLADPASVGLTYELAGPGVYSLRELVSFVLRLIDKRRSLLPVPFAVAALQARLFELLPSPPLTTGQVDLLRTDNLASGALPGLPELDIEPKAIEDIVPTYLGRPMPQEDRP